MSDYPSLSGLPFDELELWVETTSVKEGDVCKKYQQLTGYDPTGDLNVRKQENKWGAEYRITFRAPLSTVDAIRIAGFRAEPLSAGKTGPQYHYITNSEDLFWFLVERGCRLGHNGPITLP